MRLYLFVVVALILAGACSKSEDPGGDQEPTAGETSAPGEDEDQDTDETSEEKPSDSDSDEATGDEKAATDGDSDSDEATGEGGAGTDSDADSDEATGEGHDGDHDTDEATGEGKGQGDGKGTTKGPPKNLEVLPKDWSRKRVVKEMKEWNRGLGVKCEFCHDTKDYASDDNKHKGVAREMVTMQKRLNKQYFGGKPKVSCYTCHQGKAHPAK